MRKFIILLFLIITLKSVLISNENYWVYLDNFPCPWNVRDITFDTMGNGYMACSHIYKTTDDGLSWELLEVPSAGIWNIIFDRKGYLYVTNNDGHLLRSKDSGKTWEDITKNVGWGVSDRGMIINKRGHLLVGEYRTTDNGDTWTNEDKYLGEYFSYAMNSEGHIFRGG